MIDKSDYAKLFVNVALSEEKFSRDKILTGIGGHYGDVWIYTDDFSLFLNKTRTEPGHNFDDADDFEDCFIEFVKTQITDDQLRKMIESAIDPFPYFS